MLNLKLDSNVLVESVVRKKFLYLILISTIFLVACNGNKEDDDLPTIQDMKEVAVEAETAEIEKNKLALKDIVDKHFLSEHYFEDYTELIQSLNAYFEERLLKDASHVWDRELYVDANIEFFNASLFALKNGDLSMEDFYENKESHIKNYSVDYFYVLQEEDFSEPNTSMRKAWEYCYVELMRPLRMEGVYELNARIIFLDPDRITSINSSNANIIDLNNAIIHVLLTHNDGTDVRKIDPEIIASISKKYNKQFVFYGLPKNALLKEYYAPVDALDLFTEIETFEYIDDTAMYATLSQKLMNDEVDKIIKKYGAEDYIGYFNYPDYFGENDLRGDGFDMSHIEPLTFLNKSYRGKFEQSLYYFLEKDEPIDKKVIMSIIAEIQELVEDTEAIDGRQDIFVFFYDMAEEDIRIASDLFRKNALCVRSNAMPEVGLENIYNNMFVTRYDTEAFKFMDLKGEKREYLLRTSRDHSDITDNEYEDVFESITYQSIFGD